MFTYLGCLEDSTTRSVPNPGPQSGVPVINRTCLEDSTFLAICEQGTVFQTGTVACIDPWAKCPRLETHSRCAAVT